MPEILTASSAYQGTFVIGTVETEPTMQVCAVGSINASNQFECTFWINKNGELLDSNLGTAEYKIRDKSGALVSGMAQTGIAPDINGYFRITPVLAPLIYDLTHYVIEISVSAEGSEHKSAIGLGIGE